MQIEAKCEVFNSVLLKKPCRHVRLSQPEFRALKKLAQVNENSVDEEIFNALELWEKACRKETDLSFWSQTEPRFKCLHDVVELRYCSDSEPELIEAAIRRHIHDFDTNSEHETNACRMNEALIVTLQMDESVSDRLWKAKRTTGKSMSNFVQDAITNFICHLTTEGRTETSGIAFENQNSAAPKPRRMLSTQTLHVSLSRKLIEELCRLLQFNRREIERAVILAINWKLVRPCACS